MQKKIFSTILILCVLLCTMALTLSIGAADYTVESHNWTETINDPTYGQMYVIDSSNDLIALSHTPALWGANFYVESNINVGSGVVYDGGTTSYTTFNGYEFKPIGTSSNPFRGKFIGYVDTNGNRRTITLNVNANTNDAGLFAYAGNDAHIENIVICGSVTSTGNNVAGLVGHGLGNLTIKDCTNRAVVTGKLSVGGLIGCYEDSAQNSTLVVTLNKDRKYYANEYSENASGNVVDNKNGILISTNTEESNGNPEAKLGGAIGYIGIGKSNGTKITITNADNRGKIGNDNINKRNVGGVVGYVYTDGATSNATVKFEDCDNIMPINSTCYQVGGIAGVVLIQSNTTGAQTDDKTTNISVTFTNCTNSGDITASHYTGGIVGLASVKHYADSNTITLTGCTNSGNVTANASYTGTDNENPGKKGYDAGGIVGLVLFEGNSSHTLASNGVNNAVEINTCKNTGTVTAYTKSAGGILGRIYANNFNNNGNISESEKKPALAVTNCENGVKGNANKGNVITKGNIAAGIVGFVETHYTTYHTDIVISGTNYGTVTKESADREGQIAGIVGNANPYGQYVTLTVKDSANYANFGSEGVALNEKNFGGIVGRVMISGATDYSSSNNKVTIDNCTNNGNMYTCHVNDNAASVGGVLGAFVFQAAQEDNTSLPQENNALEVKNCTNNGIVKGVGSGTYGANNSTGYSNYIGGIVGQVLNQYSTDGMKVTVSGCKNTGAVSTVGQAAGGIMGYYRAIHCTKNAEITFDGNENSGSVSADRFYAGGILGQYHIHGAPKNQASNTKTTAPKLSFKGENTNSGAISAPNNAGGILGIYYHENQALENSILSINGAINNGSVYANVAYAGGIIGRYHIANDPTNTGSEVTVTDSHNNGTVTVGTQRGGGILGCFTSGSLENAEVNVTSCTNNGTIISYGDFTVTNTDGRVGGIVGFIEGNYGKNINFTISKCDNNENGLIEVANGKRGGGIVSNLDYSSTSTGMNVTITECNNYAEITGKQEMAGILARVDAAATNASLIVEKCANYGKITATASRAGGITATYYYQNKAGTGFSATYSQCYNEGDINAAYQAGGIAAQVVTLTADNTTIENCLNVGNVTTTSTTSDRNSSGTAGIVGSSYLNDSGKVGVKFVIRNCYNKGIISATETRCGNIIGQIPDGGTMNITGAFYAPQTLKSGAITLGTKATEDVAFETLDDVKVDGAFVWTYGRNNGLELKYLHECVANNYSFDYSGTQLTTKCESINCTNETTLFGKTYTTVPTTIYVKNNSTFNSGAMYGTKDNPFKTLEEANDYIGLVNKAVTVKIVGEVKVPADYKITAAVITGNDANSILYFPNKTEGYGHYHTFVERSEGAKIEKIRIETADNSGLFFYAHGNPLEMGVGLTMLSRDGDEYNIVDNNVTQTTGLGARVYVFGGHNVKMHLEENSDVIGDVTSSADLTAKAPAPTGDNVLKSNIIVRSGDYRHVSGWSYEFDYTNPGNGETFEYQAPTTGTTNMVIGKTNANDTLRITNISPFGCDYESVGEGRVANITIDGDVEVYQFNLGSHLVVNEGAEKKYPVTINLCLKGDMHGMEKFDPDSWDENPWGFYAGAHSSIAVMGNIWVGVEKDTPYYNSSVLDAHAFLGHGSYCTDDDGYQADRDYNYAHRSIIYIEPCTTHNNPVTKVSDYNLAATCVSLPMNRIVCADCGGFVRSEMVKNGAFDPNNHAVFAGLGFSNMYPVAGGVRLGDDTTDNKCCNTTAAPVIGEDGVFYVSDKGTAKYSANWGSENNPISDFMIAYRLATAYAEYTEGNPNGRDAEIRVIDSITWNLKNVNAGYNDSPNRTFDYHLHMPGTVTVTSANPSNKATFIFGLDPSAQRSYIRLSGALEMNNLNIDFTNEFVKKADGTLNLAEPTRIHILARDNAITMGKGLTMVANTDGVGTFKYTNGVADHTAQEHICIHGGYDGVPEDIDMNTQVTVLSGSYYYIGGTNYNYQGKIFNGTATITVGADTANGDTLRTGYLSSYGVGAENTGNFTSNINIVGKVDVFTLEPTAQNGYVAENNLGAQTQKPRISNIYLKDGADLTLDCVHENGAFVRGEYEVNVYVGDNVTANTLTSLHKICGHDDGFTSQITGKENHQHINAFANICTVENCPLKSSAYAPYDAAKTSFVGYSYLCADKVNNALDNKWTSDIRVNVYKLSQSENLNTLVTWNYAFDSGAYVEGKNTYGIARFIFDGVPYAGAQKLVEDSGIIYLFSSDIKTPDTQYIIGESGNAQTFYADVTKIPTTKTDDIFAVAYMRINGKMYFSNVLNGAVDFDRQVALD